MTPTVHHTASVSYEGDLTETKLEVARDAVGADKNTAFEVRPVFVNGEWNSKIVFSWTT